MIKRILCAAFGLFSYSTVLIAQNAPKYSNEFLAIGVGAIGVVGIVEVDGNGIAIGYFQIQISASAVGFLSAGFVGKWHEQVLFVLFFFAQLNALIGW